ncbi:MAG: alpha/beta-type small acid-soluble spore protein [Candidatus Limivivens sp.]|nr:alpha/beta-type small acid-soluble spore protein [Candidatus Limivivens sp.]
MANRSSNTAAVPEAKGALDRFKMEVASEIGVPLTEGYNGNLTSRQNGSVGGYMVKKMIEAQERQMSGQGAMGMGAQSGMGTQSGMSGQTGMQ